MALIVLQLTMHSHMESGSLGLACAASVRIKSTASFSDKSVFLTMANSISPGQGAALFRPSSARLFFRTLARPMRRILRLIDELCYLQCFDRAAGGGSRTARLSRAGAKGGGRVGELHVNTARPEFGGTFFAMKGWLAQAVDTKKETSGWPKIESGSRQPSRSEPVPSDFPYFRPGTGS